MHIRGAVLVYLMLLLSDAQADTVRLANGTVLTGTVTQVGSIIEVRSSGRRRYFGLNKLHPEDRVHFEARAGIVTKATGDSATPVGQTLSDVSRTLNAPEPSAQADTTADEVVQNAYTDGMQTLLRTVFSTNASQVARESAAEELRNLGYDGPVDPLIEQMGSADEMVTVRALSVMHEMPSLYMLEPVLARLVENRWQDKDNVRRFAEIMAGVGPIAVPRIIETSRQCDYARGYDLIKAMGYLNDPRITEHLAEFVEQPEGNDAREAAFSALAQIGSTEAIEAIIEPLCHSVETDDPDYLVAAPLLGRIGDIRGVEPLIHAMKREEAPTYDWNVAVEALGELKDPRAVRPLLGELRTADTETRWVVAEALGDIAHPAALKPLLSLMVCLDGDLRMTAAEGIGKIGDLRTAGVLIAYLNAADDDDPYEPLLCLGEMGGARAYRAIKQRISTENSDGTSPYHGTKALKKIEAGGTAEADVSTSSISLWHLCCWIGFLSRWLVIVVMRFRMMVDPARLAEDQMGRKPLWFERFILVLLVGLCAIRLLYVLVFHLNPGALEIAVAAGMPLGRYILCSVMDPLVVLLTIRAVFRLKRWGWPLLFAYIPSAILLSRYDYGYWTTVTIVGAAWLVIASGAWLLGNRLAGRPAKAAAEPEHGGGRRSRLTKSLLTALVALNSTRLLFSIAMSAVGLRFFMMWGWDALSVALGIIASAVGGVADAAIMYLVNKLVLKLIGRPRTGQLRLQYTIDALTGLILGGLCLSAVGYLVYNAINEPGSIAQALAQVGIPLLLIAALSVYPATLVWKGREQGLLRYFVIVTIIGYLVAQPLALVWLWNS